MNPLARTDLPWWLALATLVGFFVDSYRRRRNAGVVRPWLRSSAAELVMNLVGVYVVFGLAQISDTILTTPPPSQMRERAELWNVLLLLLLVPLATIAAIVAPTAVPTPGRIERTADGWPSAPEWKRMVARTGLVLLGTRIVGAVAWWGATRTDLLSL